MSHWLINPHLDLTTLHLETDRCIIVPFSSDGRVDIYELWKEFCHVNKNYTVGPLMPTYEQEVGFISQIEQGIAHREYLECFILEKNTKKLIGCFGLNSPEEDTMNIGTWICEGVQGVGYGTEIYTSMIQWARDHVRYEYLKHACVPDNEGSKKLALKFGGILQDELTERGWIVYHIPLR